MAIKKEDLESCARCAWPYPVDYLHPLVGSMFGQKGLCGICAIHGLPMRTPFSGEMANAADQDAQAWRRDHPELKPTAVTS